MPSIAAFLSFACIMSFTPGPNNIMALSSASAYGLRKGLRFCFGVLLGVLGLMTACALFGAALFRFLPDLYGITAFSSFVLPYYDSFMALAVSIGVLSAVAYAGTCFWALFGAVFRRFLQNHHTAANASMALLLVWCAASLYT